MERQIFMNGFQSIDGLSRIAGSFDACMIDQFGVLHDGQRPYPEAIECLTGLKALGKRVVLLSNSGKRAEANIARLEELGFSRATFDHVVTSGEVTWHGILDHRFGPPFLPGNSMFLVGHDDYDYGFERIGMVRAGDPAAADFVMIAASRAPRMSLSQYGAALAAAAAAKIPALCCNPDRLMLTTSGLQPSAGEIASTYARLGGEVTFVGKPYPAIYDFARKQIPAVETGRIVAIGDSIEHDIRGGSRAGIATVLTRTGVSADLSEDQLTDEMRRHDAAPDFVLSGLRW